MLIFWSLVRNSVVLAVYLLFSVACFLTVHEHSKRRCGALPTQQAIATACFLPSTLAMIPTRRVPSLVRSPAYSTGWTEYPPNGLKSSGAKTSSRGAFFADLALCPHAVRGDPPQGAKIASQAAHVDENRPISGRLGRSWGRPISASQRVTDAFRGMLDPASRREDTRRDG